MYIQSASWRSLHHNTRLTSSVEYRKRHYHLENATISIYTMSKLLVFLYFPLHANFCEYSRGDPHHLNRTSTAHPSIRSHLTVACLGRSAWFDTGFTVEAQRREDYSIDVRLSNVTTTVRPAHTPQSARTSQKHARGSSARFDTGRWVGTAEVKCQMYI